MEKNDSIFCFFSQISKHLQIYDSDNTHSHLL